MAVDVPNWLKPDPELFDRARHLIKSVAEELTGLSASLSDDEAIVFAVRMTDALERTESGLRWDLETLERERLQQQPDAPGLDWACASADNAADVVAACGRMYKRRTDELDWRWLGKLQEVASAGHINNRLWNRWRRGEVPVDRRIVAAALKLAMVEDARELQLTGAKRSAASNLARGALA